MNIKRTVNGVVAVILTVIMTFGGLQLILPTLDLGLKAGAAVTGVSALSETVYFNVPETIYLDPAQSGGHYNFEYVCDQNLDTSTGKLSPNSYKTMEKRGNIQFYSNKKLSGVKLSCVQGSGNSVNYTTISSTNNQLWTSSLTGGYFKNYDSNTIQWKIEYKVNNDDDWTTVYAYTYVYAPFKFAAAAIAATTAYRSRSYRWCAVSTAIYGSHQIERNIYADSPYCIDDYYHKDYTQTKSDGEGTYAKTLENHDTTENYEGGGCPPSTLFTSGGVGGCSYYYKDKDSQQSASVLRAGGTGQIYFDSSRCKVIGDIPNFFCNSFCTGAGSYGSGTNINMKYAAKYWIEYIDGKSIQEKKYVDNTLLDDSTKIETIDPPNVSNIEIENGCIFTSTVARSTQVKIALPGTTAYCQASARVEFLAVDKSDLRRVLQEALQCGLSNTSINAYKNAYEILGKPDATQAEIDSAYNSIKPRKATVEYYSTRTSNITNTKVIGKEEKYYVSGDTVKVSTVKKDGYVIDESKNVCTIGKADTYTKNLFSGEGFNNSSPKDNGKDVLTVNVDTQNNSVVFSSKKENGSVNDDCYSKNINISGNYRVQVSPGEKYIVAYDYFGTKARFALYGNSGQNTSEYESLGIDDTNDGCGTAIEEFTPTTNYVSIRFGCEGYGNTVRFSNIVLVKASDYTVSSNKEENADGTISYTYDHCKCASISYKFYYDPIKYTVKYYGNGATGGSMNSTECYYDDEYEYPYTTYTNKYKIIFNPINGDGNITSDIETKFLGWNRSSTELGNYVDFVDDDKKPIKFSNLTTKNEEIIYYAHWGDVGTAVVPSNPTRLGYVFRGWFESKEVNEGDEATFTESDVGKSIDPLTYCNEENNYTKTFYAHWKISESKIEIILNADDATFDLSSVSFSDGSGEVPLFDTGNDADATTYIYKQEYMKDISLPLPTRENYTFLGWNRTTTNGTLANKVTSYQYTFGPYDGLTDILRAMWTPKTYYINYLRGKGGSLSWETDVSMAKVAYLYDDIVTSPPEPTRTSFIFDGWDMAIPERMPGQNLTISATWKDEPNAEYNETANVIKNGCAVYLEGKNYSSLNKANYVKPVGITAEDNEIVLNPFNTTKAQAIAFGVKMTDESNAYLSMRAIDGVAYVVVSGTKVDEEGNPVTKVIKLTSGEKSYFEVTDLLEPGKSGYITVRPSGIDDEYTNYSYFAVDELKLTTDNELSDKAKLESIEDSDIDTIQNIVVNIPDNILPIDIPDVIFEKLITKIFIKKTNKDSTNNLDYKTTLTLYNEVENYAGKKITWYVDDGSGKFIRKASNTDGSLTLKNLTKNVKVKCVTKDSDGEEVSSEIETFTVKTGIWQKIVALFRGWFGKLPNVKY